MLHMSANELVVRGRQAARKWLDRMAAMTTPVAASEQERPRGTITPRPRAGDRPRVASAPMNHFRERATHCFFEGATRADATAHLIAQMPESRERIISAAETVCAGRFDLLGYRGLDFGDPVDWHLDPISRRRAPFVHWSRLDPLDPATVGDSKVVWELNRHQWLLHLGQAYRLTGNERYVRAFVRSVDGWMRANPMGMGINWTSSLEVAFRLISWCWALLLFDGARTLPAELPTEMLVGIGKHARHIERYLSLYFSPNTHLTGEALGLVYAGVLFPDLSRARRWRTLGAQILVEQCERHISADGVYFEQSTYYQRYTAEIYLQFLILAGRNGIDVPGVVADRIQRLLDFLMAVRRSDGSMPQIGDADGGWLLPVLPRAPDDLRGVFSVASALFRRSDYAWAAGGLAPETLWLVGPGGATVVKSLTPAPPDAAPSRLYPDGGYAVMSSGWERDANQMIVDVGPLGDPISGVHGHADLLSVQCAAFGEPYIIDPGTYSYEARPLWRDFFRSTGAHSTVRVDDQEQAAPAGPFKWQARPSARLQRWLSTEAFDFVDAQHDAYARLPDPVRHRRRVLFVKPSYWVVVDDLEGAAKHRVELRFQFAPMEVTLDPNHWVHARGRSGRLLVRPFTTVDLQAEIHAGERTPIRGWVSGDYGRREPAPVLIYSADARLPLRIATILLPTAHVCVSPPAVSPLVNDRGSVAGLVFDDKRVRVLFGDDGNVEVSSL